MHSVMKAAARASIAHYKLQRTVDMAGEDDTAGDLDLKHKCLNAIIGAAAKVAHDNEAKQLLIRAVRAVLHGEGLGMSTAPCTMSFKHVDGLASLLVDSLLLNSASFIWTQFAMLILHGDDTGEGEPPPPSFVFANVDAPDDHTYG